MARSSTPDPIGASVTRAEIVDEFGVLGNGTSPGPTGFEPPQLLPTGLRSLWFGEVEYLQSKLSLGLVTIGDLGDRIIYPIQGALQMLDYALISPKELVQKLYGDSTAAAVFKYKIKRGILNSLDSRAQGQIVDQETLQYLDDDMLALETQYTHLLLSFGVPAQPNGTVVVQHPVGKKKFATDWAKQFVDANQGNPGKWSMRLSPVGTPKQGVEGLQQIIQETGASGIMIFAVGHGILSTSRGAGGFDLADNGVLRIGGKGAYTDPKFFVDIEYDTEDDGTGHTPMQADLSTQNLGAKQRLDNWALWQNLCKTFRDTHLGVVILLTCNIGNDPTFLKKVAGLWKTPIVAYKDFISYEGKVPGQQRARAVLDRDADTQSGTDTPFAETHIPMSQRDIVVIGP